MNAQIVWLAVQFEETKRSNKSIVRCKFIDLRQYFHTHLYTYVYDGVSNHRAQQNCMPRQELCSISIIIILAGWLVGHATCIELYCEHNARLSSLSSSSSSYLDTVLLLVAVVHGGGTGGVRRRRPPRMHRLFQSPAKSWRIVKASLLSATTSLGRLLHHYVYVICCANTLRPFLFCGAVLDPSRLLFALRRGCSATLALWQIVVYYFIELSKNSEWALLDDANSLVFIYWAAGGWMMG